jgi:hypothetical protein
MSVERMAKSRIMMVARKILENLRDAPGSDSLIIKKRHDDMIQLTRLYSYTIEGRIDLLSAAYSLAINAIVMFYTKEDSKSPLDALEKYCDIEI